MKALSLFSGIGLHDLGLERAGWEIAAQVEIDPWCREVLVKHWPSVPRWEDVRDVTAESLSGLGRIELVTGGFPCQDISSAGRGLGIKRGERSSLWSQMLRIIKLVLPTFVLAENVPALFSRGIDTVLADLEEAGYAAWPVVVGAWAVGAPHRRDRVWIVGCRVAGTEGQRLEGWEAGERSAPWTATRGGVPECRAGQPNHGDAARLLPGPGEDQGTFLRGPQAGTPGRRAGATGGARVGHSDPQRRGGAGAEAYQGRERSRNGRSGRMADPNSGALRLESGRIGGEGWTGETEPGDAGEGVADAYGSRLRTGRFSEREHADADQGGSGVAHGESERRGEVWPEPEGQQGRSDTEICGNAGLAYRHGEGLAIHKSEPGNARAELPPAFGSRWPARRGEPQHSWEPPRLTQSGLGRGLDGRAARLDGFARRNRLKALGNANPWQAPYLIGRWMLERISTPEPD